MLHPVTYLLHLSQPGCLLWASHKYKGATFTAFAQDAHTERLKMPIKNIPATYLYFSLSMGFTLVYNVIYRDVSLFSKKVGIFPICLFPSQMNIWCRRDGVFPSCNVYGKPNKDAIRKDVLYDWHERREYR